MRHVYQPDIYAHQLYQYYTYSFPLPFKLTLNAYIAL